jgi:hypothetical protein
MKTLETALAELKTSTVWVNLTVAAENMNTYEKDNLNKKQRIALRHLKALDNMVNAELQICL